MAFLYYIGNKGLSYKPINHGNTLEAFLFWIRFIHIRVEFEYQPRGRYFSVYVFISFSCIQLLSLAYYVLVLFAFLRRFMEHSMVIPVTASVKWSPPCHHICLPVGCYSSVRSRLRPLEFISLDIFLD